MNERKPLLVDAADFLAQKPGDNLPAHQFNIERQHSHANIEKLPSLRIRAFA